MRIALEHPDQPEVHALIAALDAYQTALYPPESHHGIDMAALSRSNVLFAVLRVEGSLAAACGAVVLMPEFGELKRMFVAPAHRGRGLARKLLAFLECKAAQSGCAALALETGIHQHEALALYAAAGFARRGPFGSYTDDPLSVFMHKTLRSSSCFPEAAPATQVPRQ